MSQFTCYLVEKGADGRVTAGLSKRDQAELPEGEVLIRVELSSLNYKDGLAATGQPGVARKFPHVPGIDAAGEVARAASPIFSRGKRCWSRVTTWVPAVGEAGLSSHAFRQNG